MSIAAHIRSTITDLRATVAGPHAELPCLAQGL